MNFVQWLVGPAISKIIMPSQLRVDKFQATRAVKQKNNVDIKHVGVNSTGGAVLDLATFEQPKKPHSKVKDRKLIIFFMGQSLPYETKFDYLIAMAKRYPNATIASFNFRNVGASTGRVSCEQDWVDDARAIVDHFRDLGFCNQNILLSGYSLGGAIATMMAHQVYQHDIKAANGQKNKVEPLRLISNRSLSDLIEEIIVSLLGKKVCATINTLTYSVLIGLAFFAMPFMFGMGIAVGKAAMLSALVGTANGAILGAFSMLHEKFCYDMIRPWVTLVLKITFGKMDAISAYRELPEHAKDFLVVKNDSRIKKLSGLYYRIKDEVKSTIRDIFRKYKKLVIKLDGVESTQEADTIKGQMSDIEDNLRDKFDCKLRHKIVPKDGHCAHVDRLDLLTTYHHMRGQADTPPQIDGQTVLENKINRLLKIK